MPLSEKSGQLALPGLFFQLNCSGLKIGNYLNSFDLSTKSTCARLKQVHLPVSLS